MGILQPTVTLIIGLLSAAIAIVALFTNVASLRLSVRPMLRPIRKHPEDSNLTFPDRLLLKNIGRGSALSIKMIALNDRRHTILGQIGVIEPLGPKGPGGETQRVGRRGMQVDPEWPMSDGEEYRVMYQDVDGRWHESRFMFKSDQDFPIRLLGRVYSWSIPYKVRDAALIRERV